ncbi:MAG: PH domain-containing protein [Gemmatimonadetes bacterium]|nr:PH domain-containing protein [Gemmatimonadota bacterium]
MPSEGRLHPLSIPFRIGSELRRAVFPLLFGAAGASAFGVGLQTIALLATAPIVLSAIVRYLTFRYSYGDHELVLKSGLFFRRERHVPYNRIQNLDAVQGVLHRVLGVVEVRLQTGSGDEPEAKLTVLPIDALDELRRHVFEGRALGAEPDELRPPSETAAVVGDALMAGEGIASRGGPVPLPVAAAPGGVGAAGGETLLHLPPRELLIYGLIQNRGMIVIAAAFGLLWQTNVMDRILGRIFGEEGMDEQVVESFFGRLFDAGLSIGSVAAVLAVILGFVLLARALSVGWVLIRLHDYTVSRTGEDLRATFGLFTQVAATIPLRRVQTVTVHEGPLHRWAGRAAVRVETAGGTQLEQADPHRQWLAPIIRTEHLGELLAHVMPEVELPTDGWETVASGARGRVFRRTGLVALGVSIPFFIWLGWPAALLLGALLASSWVYATKHVEHLEWIVKDDAVTFRSGWLWRRTTVARFAKIQAVAVRESPFDRRRDMARVTVDTAGAGSGAHRVDIPYLPHATAAELGRSLAAEAAQTAFRW